MARSTQSHKGEHQQRSVPYSLLPTQHPRSQRLHCSWCRIIRHLCDYLPSSQDDLVSYVAHVCVGGGGDAHALTCVCTLSCVQFFETPWTLVHQAPLSMGFFWQEYRSGCHFLLQWIFAIQGSNSHLLGLLHWQEDSLPLHHLTCLQLSS